MDRRALGNGYFAIRFYVGGHWIVYHENFPRRALWEGSLGQCARMVARFPETLTSNELHPDAIAEIVHDIAERLNRECTSPCLPPTDMGQVFKKD